MNKARVYVDFNEMVENDLVLLSRDDTKLDSDGSEITFHEGMPVAIYMNDEIEHEKPDNLIADGIAVRNTFGVWPHVKWCCRIDHRGVRYQSDESADL